jgi:DNA-binding response OmpR family regulator
MADDNITPPDGMAELAGRLLYHLRAYKKELQASIKAEFTDDDGSFWTDAYDRYLTKQSTHQAKEYHRVDETIRHVRQWAKNGQPIPPDDAD